ncbi:MAG: hypothetical protein WAW11_05160, partial [Patescibacteria group bacterium]
MSLAEQNNYDLELVDNIFTREDCTFPYMWVLLNKVEYILPVLENAVKNKSFKRISFEQFRDLLIRVKKEEAQFRGYGVYNLLLDLKKQKGLDKFSVEELFSLGKRIGYLSPITDCINRKKTWQETDFQTVHDLLIKKGLDSYPELQNLLVSHHVCP